MSGINKVILIGNLGQDPEFKHTQGGQGLLKLRVAVSEKWQDASGERQERTEWVTCTMWGKRAEALSRFLEKGQQVYVEGKLQTRSWDKDGEKRYSTEVNVMNLETLGGKRGDGQRIAGNGNVQIGGGPSRRDEYDNGDDGDAEIPF